MGDSHYRSNIIAKVGTETLKGFTCTVPSMTATLLVAGTSVTAPAVAGTTSVTAPTVTGSTKVVGTGYLQVGTKFIFPTVQSHAASIQAEATLLIGGTCTKGSMALGAGELFLFTSDNVATMITVP